MSGIDLLPDDLLSELLLLVEDKSAEQKFALAQVSRRWRSVALNSPLLWSSFRLATMKDWIRLPVLLDLTGSSSLLDVELWAESDDMDDTDDIDDASLFYHLEALVPYAPRMRTVVARLGYSEQGFAPLLDGRVDFPVLDTLRVHGPLGQVNVGVASAPLLRVLEISFISLLDGKLPISEKFEEINLVLCGNLQGADLLPVLSTCPHLRRLTLRNFKSAETWSGVTRATDRIRAPNLRTMDLQLALDDILDVLGRVDGVLPEIAASIYNGHDEEDMKGLYDAMLRGVGALSSFEVQNDQRITVRDAGGCTRTMGVWNGDSCWDIAKVWCHLSDKYSLHMSVRLIQITTACWNELADALEEHPVQAAQGLKMRILTDWKDVDLLRQGGMRELRAIDMQGLDCVELACGEGPGTSLPPPVVLHILRSLPLRDGQTIPVVVIVNGAVPKGTSPYSWKESISSYLRQEGWGQWHLSFQ